MKMEKATGTHVETIEFTPDAARAWELAPFQRGVTVNQKVKDLAEQIKGDGGVIPGVICFGVLDRKTYLIDGQQRREAFLMSEKPLGYADARYCKCENMAQMAREFVQLNGHLVSMKPDDILRGLECCLPAIKTIRDACPFVGFDSVRRNERSPILSMSVALRFWWASRADIPASVGISSAAMAEMLTEEEAPHLIGFLDTCMESWGRHTEYIRLWGAVNLTLCAWLYRRLVLSTYSPKTPRLNKAQFSKCLMGLSADPVYLDYLLGRHLGERDRAPTYARIKAIFVKRLDVGNGKKAMLPAPAWAHGTHS